MFSSRPKKSIGHWLWLVLVPLLIAAGIWAASTLRFQSELLPIFPRNLPSVRGLKMFQERFALANDVTLVFQIPSPSQHKEIVQNLKSTLSKLPEIESVETLGEFNLEWASKMAAWQTAHLTEDRFREFQDIFQPKELESRLSRSRKLLAGSFQPDRLSRLRLDPLQLLEWLQQKGSLPMQLTGMRDSSNTSIAALTVHSTKSLKTFEECQAFVQELRAVLDQRVPQPEFRNHIFLTGRPVFVAETASQMRSDMMAMLSIATILVSLCFWLCYRSFLPLLWILLLQGLSLLCGILVARLVFGELNVIGMGFATILLGVGMDYCILVYHFHALHPLTRNFSEWQTLRRGIWISAVTTAGSFGILYFSSFPGFKQLSLLIGVGLLATAFFATELLPLLLVRFKPKTPSWLSTATDRMADLLERRQRTVRYGLLFVIVISVAAYPLYQNFNFYSKDLKRLRPSGSEAYRGLELLSQIHSNQTAFSLILRDNSSSGLRSQIRQLERGLGTDLSSLLFWIPEESSVELNRSHWKPGKGPFVQKTFQAAGFDESWSRSTSLFLQELDRWKEGKEDFGSIRMLRSQLTHSSHGESLALAQLAIPPSSGSIGNFWERIHRIVPSALPSDWALLGEELHETAKFDFKKLSFWMLGILVLLCWIAHRSLRLVALNGAALGISLLLFFILLFLTGQSMTILSLLTIPLLIGLVIDYSLHLLLALEEAHGNLRQAFRHLAVPVFLTGITSIIGFGCPAISRQPSLQNFGLVMDLGIISAVITGLLVLPVLFIASIPNPHYSKVLYRAFWFERAVRLCSRLHPSTVHRLASILGWIYACLHPNTRRAVRHNLTITRKSQVPEAEVRKVFVNYGITIADYFFLGIRSREQVLKMAGERIGLEHLKKAQSAGKGAILATPHLGLFELGGVILTELGIQSIALTLPEPSEALTSWRTAYRAQWGVRTLQIGENAFASLDVVRHLHQGNFIALLVDRPQSNKYIPIDFPNGKVAFSTGPVLLSLLAGCPLLPVSVARTGRHYRLEVQKPIHPYWLPSGRNATIRFYTHELARALQPVICQYSDQWYQFLSLECAQ